MAQKKAQKCHEEICASPGGNNISSWLGLRRKREGFKLNRQ